MDGEERPLEGIAPSVYSVSLMYERGDWSLGATADHTDGFVTAINVARRGLQRGGGPDHLGDRAYRPTTSTRWLTSRWKGQNLLDDEQTYTINGDRLMSQGCYRCGRSINLCGREVLIRGPCHR